MYGRFLAKINNSNLCCIVYSSYIATYLSHIMYIVQNFLGTKQLRLGHHMSIGGKTFCICIKTMSSSTKTLWNSWKIFVVQEKLWKLGLQTFCNIWYWVTGRLGAHISLQSFTACSCLKSYNLFKFTIFKIKFLCKLLCNFKIHP